MRCALFLLLLSLHHVIAYNIVLYMTLVGKSHLDFASTLIDKLSKRGHNVDMVLSRLNTAKQWPLPKGVRRFADFSIPGKNPWMTVSHLNNPFIVPKEKLLDFGFTSLFYHTTNLLCSEAIKDDRIINFLREGNYDLAITSHYDFCPFILFHASGIDNIVTFSPTTMLLMQTNAAGLPSPPSYVVDFLVGYENHMELNFVQRAKNFVRRGAFEFFVFPNYVKEMNAIARARFGQDFPSVDSLSQRVALMFVNTNELFEMPRPICHKIKYIGGINRKEPRNITKEFDRILARAPVGNVIFSFGTQVPSENIPNYVKKAFIAAFSNFPMYNFLWKYDESEDDKHLFRNANNVYPVPWLPQTDLLHDKRVHAFISHLGLNSLLEASYAGVPVLAIPLFADQRWNAVLAKKRGIAEVLQRDKITEQSLTAALRKVLNNTDMLERSSTLSAMINKKPEQVEKQFIEWVEYAAEFKNLHEHLALQGAAMSIFVHYCVDVLLVLVAVLLTSVFIIRRVAVFLSSKIKVTIKHKPE